MQDNGGSGCMFREFKSSALNTWGGGLQFPQPQPTKYDGMFDIGHPGCQYVAWWTRLSLMAAPRLRQARRTRQWL
jgi:hypothetical protein